MGIVIPQNMLVNGCISVNGLKKIIDNNEAATVKSAEQRGNLKRPASSSSIAAEDSTYGSDSEGSEHTVDGKPVRKRANLDHLSPEEKLMRRKLKNRVAAQNARDKKRTKMEEMEAELLRLKNHAKSLECKNAELVGENQRLVAENDDLRSNLSPESKAKRPVVLLSQDKPLSQQCSLMYLSSRNRFVLDRQVGHWARQPP